MTEKKRNKGTWETSLLERASFAVYGVGLSIFFVLIGSFLQQFYLINAAVPAGVVGAIFLVVKIWDGINDPIFGVIVDRARLKKGKYLPWMRIATLFLPFTAALLFFVPTGAPMAFKAFFLLVGYMLFDAACTMTEVPYFAVTTAMTGNTDERSGIISLSKVISNLLVVVVLFIPAMYQHIGWQWTAAIFAALAMLPMLPGCYAIKERHNTQNEEPPKVKALLGYLRMNKYLLIFFSSAILYGLTNTAGSMGNLFAIYNLGSQDMIVPVLVLSFVPGIIAIFVVNKLLHRIEKIHILYGALLVNGVLSVVMYFTGYDNLTLFFLLNGIRGFAAGAHTMLFFLFTPDLSEYGTYITGLHAEGAAFSVQSFASKILGAIASVVSLFLLAAIGFVEGEGAVQSDQVLHGIWMLITLFPAIGIVLQSVVLGTAFKLRDKDVKVMIQANTGKISYEQADLLLEGRYPRKEGSE